MTLLAVAIAAGTYAAALPVYMFFRVSRPVLVLGSLTEAIASVGEDLARRDSVLDQALMVARGLARRSRAEPDSVAAARRWLDLGRAPLAIPSRALFSLALRAAFARTDDALSRLASALTEFVEALERGRVPNATETLIAVEQLVRVADHAKDAAARIARADVVAGQRELREAVDVARRDTIIWLIVGVLFVPALAYVVRRRVWRPLSELETGLAQVADGDLTVGIPVRGADELGRLAEHFNAMTRILRDRAEEQGRFAAAGELLAGVAHEVNNPLMAIAAHAENRLADPAIDAEQRGEMTQILRQVRRATKLLRGLLRFVRATEREVTSVNLNDVVRGALDLVSYRFGVDEITVGGQLDAHLPAVAGDAIKLEQVVVNLLSNAIDALHAINPPRRLTVDTWVEDARVSVAVGDNGKGVAPEIAPRLFRPFATTKGRRGTGLGLYISRQIAREAGGDLALVALPGLGARFVLTLPVVAASGPRSSTPSPPPPSPSAASPSLAEGAQAPQVAQPLAGLRVLIVEDEEGVRGPMARYLTRRGAVVDQAADGIEGLTRLRAQPADVVLVDLRMPRMGGIDLFAQLEDEHPDMAARVLFLSGDVSQLAQSGNTPVPRERVLVKPVELFELERRILEFARGGGGEGGEGSTPG